MKSTIALIFLFVGGVPFLLMSGPIEGLRGLFAVIGAMGMSYLMTPRSKGRKKRPQK